MKTLQPLILALALAAAGPALAAGDHAKGHDHQPLHGGIVVESNDMDFELVPKAQVITLHLRDHGKPANVKGATGKLTILSGAEKMEAALAPAADDKLEAKGNFKVGPGTKFVATVNLPGKKAVNVRFAQK